VLALVSNRDQPEIGEGESVQNAKNDFYAILGAQK